jgi:hypothetical protein
MYPRDNLKLSLECSGVKPTKTLLKIRLRGERGYDISSVPMKKLQKMNGFHKKRWEIKDGFLILEAF